MAFPENTFPATHWWGMPFEERAEEDMRHTTELLRADIDENERKKKGCPVGLVIGSAGHTQPAGVFHSVLEIGNLGRRGAPKTGAGELGTRQLRLSEHAPRPSRTCKKKLTA